MEIGVNRADKQKIVRIYQANQPTDHWFCEMHKVLN